VGRLDLLARQEQITHLQQQVFLPLDPVEEEVARELLFLEEMEAQEDFPQVAVVAVEQLKLEQPLEQVAVAVQGWQLLQPISNMEDDWFILKNNKIINTIRWNGNVDTWQNPPGTIIVRTSELDFSTIIPDEEDQNLTDF
jgi:hypothetical protein